jgi:hypothetical protein
MSVPPRVGGRRATLVAKIGTVPWYTPAGTPDPDHVTDHAAAAIGYAARLSARRFRPRSRTGSPPTRRTSSQPSPPADAPSWIANLGDREGLQPVAPVIDVAAFAVTQATMAKATPLGDEGTFAERVFALASSFVGPSDAQATCPPCICGVPVAEGCSCGRDCVPPGPPGKPPPGDPLGGITPGQCRDLPRHRVSSDGKLCIPDGAKDCAIAESALPRSRLRPRRSDRSTRTTSRRRSAGAGARRRRTISYSIVREPARRDGAGAEVTITDALDVATFDLDVRLRPDRHRGIVQIWPRARATSPAAPPRPRSTSSSRSMHLDPATGIVTWKFRSIDPATGQSPTTSTPRFLPPNVDPPEEEGASSSRLAEAHARDRHRDRNRATIVFDVNAPSIRRRC